VCRRVDVGRLTAPITVPVGRLAPYAEDGGASLQDAISGGELRLPTPRMVAIAYAFAGGDAAARSSACSPAMS
jgi:hypothetical protein